MCLNLPQAKLYAKDFALECFLVRQPHAQAVVGDGDSSTSTSSSSSSSSSSSYTANDVGAAKSPRMDHSEVAKFKPAPRSELAGGKRASI